MTDERVIEILQEIKDKIDTPNRGTCDYFIVDQIENIVKRELYKLKGEEKTGKWEADWCVSVELPKYVCSVCGESVWLKTDRCPKCKAIMKGDNK